MTLVLDLPEESERRLLEWAAAAEMTLEEVIVAALRSYLAPPLSPGQADELARRVKRYREDPVPGIPWTVLQAELQAGGREIE